MELGSQTLTPIQPFPVEGKGFHQLLPLTGRIVKRNDNRTEYVSCNWRSIMNRGFVLASVVFGIAILAASTAFAASQIESLAVGYSSMAGHHAPMWIAVE